MFLKKLLLQKNYYFIFGFAFLAIFYFSTRLVIYTFLKKYFQIIDAYLLDQLLFFFIFLVFLLRGFSKKILFTKPVDWFYFFVFLAITFYLLGGLLQKYFIGDDLHVMLEVLKKPDVLNHHYVTKLDYYYYHFMPFTLIYRFFGYKVLVYNMVALAGFALAAFSIHKLLHYLSSLEKLKDKILPFLVAVFCLLTPSLLGHFHYLEHSVALGYVISASLFSIYFYLRYLEEGRKKPFLFLLSYLLLLFLLKFALTRSGFLPAILVLIEIFQFPKKKNDRLLALVRILLVLVPFWLIAKSFFFRSAPVGIVLYNIGASRFLNPARIYITVSALLPFLIPFQFLPGLVRFIRDVFNYNEYTSPWFLKNIFFSLGLICYFSYSAALAILHFRKHRVKYAAVFWLSAVVAIAFFTLAGWGEDISRDLANFDYSIIHYASQFTGAAYVLQPLSFLLISLYLFWVGFAKNHKRLKLVIVAVLILVLVSSAGFGRKVIVDSTSGHIIYRALVENVLKLVPDDNQKKVLFSVGGEIPCVKFLGVGDVGWFYKNTPPVYLFRQDELTKYLRDNEIRAKNLYAISYDEKNLLFEDKSVQLRQELAPFLVN